MLVLLLLSPLLYLLFAVVMVRYVWKKTNRKLYRFIAVGFVFLLPSWDALFASVFFYTAGPFVGKSEIYETAETDGIYYEGAYRNRVFIAEDWRANQFKVIGSVEKDIEKGYLFSESLVTMVQEDYLGKINTVPPTIFRCIKRINPDRPSDVFVNCEPVEAIQSGFLVRTERTKFGLIEIDSIRIYNRATGRLMAEYRDITKLPYIGVPYFPIFTWLNWDQGEYRSGSKYLISYPPREQFWNFQYEVLKKRNRRE